MYFLGVDNVITFYLCNLLFYIFLHFESELWLFLIESWIPTNIYKFLAFGFNFFFIKFSFLLDDLLLHVTLNLISQRCLGPEEKVYTDLHP